MRIYAACSVFTTVLAIIVCYQNQVTHATSKNNEHSLTRIVFTRMDLIHKHGLLHKPRITAHQLQKKFVRKMSFSLVHKYMRYKRIEDADDRTLTTRILQLIKLLRENCVIPCEQVTMKSYGYVRTSIRAISIIKITFSNEIGEIVLTVLKI